MLKQNTPLVPQEPTCGTVINNGQVTVTVDNVLSGELAGMRTSGAAEPTIIIIIIIIIIIKIITKISCGNNMWYCGVIYVITERRQSLQQPITNLYIQNKWI
jgi:hypothetical protein